MLKVTHLYREIQLGDTVFIHMEGAHNQELARIGAIDHDTQSARLDFLRKVDRDSAGNIVAGEWVTLWGSFAYWESRNPAVVEVVSMPEKAVA